MNKFIVNSQVLLNALLTVGKVISKKVMVPIIENYLFQVTGNRLTISGTDLQTTFRLVFGIEANQDVNFSMVVPAAITKYLQKVGELPLLFEYCNESYSILITESDEDGNKTGRAKYSGDNSKDFPLSPECNEVLYSLTNSQIHEFKDLLNYVSNDELRPAMTGICFGDYYGSYNLCATDGHKLKVVTLASSDIDHELISRYKKLSALSERLYAKKFDLPVYRRYYERTKIQLVEIEKQIEKQDFILPAKPAKILSDLKFKQDTDIQVRVKRDEATTENIVNVSFSFAYGVYTAELICRAIDEKFPQYWNVVPSIEQTKTRYTTDKKNFLRVLDKAQLFANKITHQVCISLNGSNKMSAEDLDFSNEFCAEIGGNYTGEPIEIGFNALLLKETLNSFGDTFTIDLIAPNKAAVIRQGNALALVMPVMLTDWKELSKSPAELASDLTKARHAAN